MKIQVHVAKKIKIMDGERYVAWVMNPNWKCIGYESNLPYKKSHEDWKFLAKAINKMLKEL